MGSAESISKPGIEDWLAKISTGPFDAELAACLREMSRVGSRGATFPGVKVAMPPQMILALTAWVQGRILEIMGDTCEDTMTLSAAGGAWMNPFMLQLGIILEPYLLEPTGPAGSHEAAEFHPYAAFAGFAKRRPSFFARPGLCWSRRRVVLSLLPTTTCFPGPSRRATSRTQHT